MPTGMAFKLHLFHMFYTHAHTWSPLLLAPVGLLRIFFISF